MTRQEHTIATELLGAAWAAMESGRQADAVELASEFLQMVERADGRPALVSWLEEVDGSEIV